MRIQLIVAQQGKRRVIKANVGEGIIVHLKASGGPAVSGSQSGQGVVHDEVVKVALIVAASALALYLALVIALILAGRRQDARALAGFIPDCVVLVRRLLRDDRVGRSRKLLLIMLIGYLAMPIDLIPDFIPVAGQIDDAIVVAIVLRSVLRAGGPELLREHWPGPLASLNAITRLAYGSGKAPDIADI